ncbi:hypothetical protein [Salidesulfovibrio onnuriiensis]|uniref:hypothetical protein n=1 Tax=Salidesulfovibrio onnuriiensis TaxID=2583823 RepID=UPI0011C7DF6B|nr:hypothetical protein [Salidesulfovibrio onnuriiensis]
MDMNELARTIAEEVLRQLRRDRAEQHAGECALVLAERDCLLADKVHACLGDEYELFFFGEDMHDRTPCRYILPTLSCAALAELATGGASGSFSFAVLKLLLQGREVEVLEFEYKAYAETAPGPLYSMYESHAATVAGFGLKAFRPKQPDTVRFRDTLVTEAVVREAAGASVLMVPAKALVTPQAYEVSKDLNLTIQKCL